MKTQFLSLAVFLSLTFSGSLRAEQPVIVDTKFDKVDSGGEFLTASVPLEGDLPLKMPTRVVRRPGSPALPTTITPGKEDLGSLKPPYAVLQIGEDPQRVGVAADAGFMWDLSQLHLSQGFYEISCDISPKQVDKNGAGLAINFQSQTPQFGSGIHPNRWPTNIWFLKQGLLLVGGGKKDGSDAAVLMKYQPGEIYHVVMRVDLDKKLWGLEINGEPLLEDCPLPDFMQAGAVDDLEIKGLSFATNSSNGSEADSGFVIANMAMKKLR